MKWVQEVLLWQAVQIYCQIRAWNGMPLASVNHKCDTPGSSEVVMGSEHGAHCLTGLIECMRQRLLLSWLAVQTCYMQKSVLCSGSQRGSVCQLASMQDQSDC
jgi:hypothetical protein